MNDEKKNTQGAQEVKEKVDGKEVLDPDNTSSELSTMLNTVKNQCELQCLDHGVWLLNAQLVHQSIFD